MDPISPKTRREHFLNKIAGENESIEPKTRTEYFLDKIAGSRSNESGGGGGNFVINVTDVYPGDSENVSYAKGGSGTRGTAEMGYLYLDKTWKEICNKLTAGNVCVVKSSDEITGVVMQCFATSVYIDGLTGEYTVGLFGDIIYPDGAAPNVYFLAPTEDDYPCYTYEYGPGR